MSEVVDAIVAELIVRDVDRYERNFNRATAAHDKFLASGKKLSAFTFDLGKEGQKYKAGVDSMVQTEGQAAAKVVRSRKARADAVVAQDEREVRSAKAAAKAKTDAEVSEAARSARLRKAVETGIENSRVKPGSGTNFGASVPREEGGRAFMGATTVGAGVTAAAAAQVGAEKEVNHLLADQAALQSRLSSLKGEDLRRAKEQLAEMRLIGQLQRAGLNDEQIALRLDQRRLLVERERSRSLKSSLLASTRASVTGAPGALTGIASAIGVGVAAAAIQSALDYGKALSNLSDQLGITVEDLQAYQKLAREAGVSQEQLTSAFGQFANNLGRAKQGEEEQIKLFKALGVNIRDFAKAGDALPTVIDRISQIKDPAQRAAVETRLFGESGRRLDSLLSGGAERVSALARSLQETGKALSAQEIKDLDETARKLAAVKAELQVDFARVVAANSGAIIGMAGAFATLTEKIGAAIQRLNEFGAEWARKGGLLGRLGLLPEGVMQQGEAQYRSNQMLTATGRAKLRAENNDALDKLLFGDAGPDRTAGAAYLNRQRAARVSLLRKGSPQEAEYQRLIQERGDIRRGDRASAATAPAITSPVRPGTVNNRALANLGTPAGPRGPSAEQLAKQADQRQRRYEDELARATQDLLQARRDLAGTAEERFQIDVQMLTAERDARKLEIQREANEKQIDPHRVAELQAAEEAAYQERLKVLQLEKSVQIESDANALRQQVLDTEVELLGFQESMAETAAERRRIAARRLEAERRAETASLNAIIHSADPNVSEGDRALARDRLASQDERFRARAAQDARANEGPLARYLRDLPTDAAKAQEALESLKVRGLQGLEDGFVDAIRGTRSLGDAFSSMTDQIIADMLRIVIQQKILAPFARMLGGGGQGDWTSGVGGDPLGLGGLGFATGESSGVQDSFWSQLFRTGISLFGRASGGNVVAGVPYLIGENGPETAVFGASGRVFPNGASPSIGPSSGGATTIIAPQHFDLSGVVMTETLMRQFEARNRDYANTVAARAGRAAVAAAPARMQKLSDLGS